MKRNRKGFTLAELLIVVAIIGVLVAIAIPIFTAQLERSRESTDLANARGMYAEVMAAAIGEDSAAAYNGASIKQGDGKYKAVYSPLKQMQNGWQTNMTDISIGGVPSSAWKGTPAVNGSCTITYDPTADTVTISWDGSGGGGGSGDDPGDNPGDNPSSSTHDEAQKANTELAEDIGKAVQNMMNDHALNVDNGVQITVTINNDGTISFSFSGHHTEALNQENILRMLKGKGLVNDEGKVNFDPADSTTSYKMHINKHKPIKVE